MKKKLCAAFTVAVLALGTVGLFTACGGAKDLADAELTLSQTEYVYDGTAHCPEVTVAFGDTQVESTEIAVAYVNNVNAGTATVTVTPSAKSAYTGSVSADYTISKAQSMVAEEVRLDAEYNQTIGEVLGGRHNVASKDLVTGEELSAETVLTRIGEDTYKFTSVFTPDNPNYEKANQTVYITVNKATPEQVKNLSSLQLEANLGEPFSAIEKDLPQGVAIKGAGTFENAGKQAVAVTVQQPDGQGGFDTEHYTAPELSVAVQVAFGEVAFGDYKFLYDSTAFAAGDGEGEYTVNGAVTLDGQFDMFQDWTASITFSFESLKRLNINGIFDNVTDKKLVDAEKKSDFRFDKGTCESWLGSLLTTGEGNRFEYVPEGETALKVDSVYLPDDSEWESVKITIKSWMVPNQVDERRYEIFMGNGAEEGAGTLLFRRYTKRTNPYRLQFIFEKAKGVNIINLSYTESAYGTDKLFGAGDNKMKKFISSDTTIDEKYTNGGLMMLGDAMVDYWATDYDKSWSESMVATQEMWKSFGFAGPVMNLGVGGSTAENWVSYLDYGKSYFEQFRPDYVYILVGGKQYEREDGANISKYVITMIEKVRALYPDAAILVNSIMPSTSASVRWQYWQHLADANDLIEAYIAEKEDANLLFLDFENLFTPDRTQPVSNTNAPVASYYYKDGIYFLSTAYKIWTREILDFLVEKEFITQTEITLAVVNEDGSETDISGCAKFEYTSYDKTAVIKLEVGVLQLFDGDVLYDEIYFELVSVKLGERDVTALYDAKTHMLTLALGEDELDGATLTVTVKSVENPDDNTTDDKDFQSNNG